MQHEEDEEVPGFDGDRPEVLARFIYPESQLVRNREYERAYNEWLGTLDPVERERIEAMGLGEPDTGGRSHIKDVDLDVERMADEPRSFERTDAFHAALAEVLSEFLHWLILPNKGQRGLSARAAGCRAIMAMWVMRPDIIGNLSTTEIGALVDARPEVLCRQATAFSKRFGIRGRAQFSEKTRKAQSESVKQRHAREALEKGVPSGLN